MPAEHSTRRRVIYFDILRIVAIFFVVFVHLSAQHWADVDVIHEPGLPSTSTTVPPQWSVPIFVMISGALFLAGAQSAFGHSQKERRRALSQRSLLVGLLRRSSW